MDPDLRTHWTKVKTTFQAFHSQLFSVLRTVSKVNIGIEMGSVESGANRPWLQGFSVLSDSCDVCSQLAPGGWHGKLQHSSSVGVWVRQKGRGRGGLPCHKTV